MKKTMKIVISTDKNVVSEHFGRCPSFTIVEIKDGKLVKNEVVQNPGHHPGFLPRFFHEMNIDAIIAGSMGQRARMLFDEFRIKPILGVSGSVSDVIEKLLQGGLKSGESSCRPGQGKGYGIDKTECDHD
jgi:predicted Fe-Mo cluster-binding NifX family protein